jgi:hypothetical protein
LKRTLSGAVPEILSWLLPPASGVVLKTGSGGRFADGGGAALTVTVVEQRALCDGVVTVKAAK